MLSLLIASTCAACGRDATPCLSWVDVGETYQVEVLGSFTAVGTPLAVPPHHGFVASDPSCGTSVGDALESSAVPLMAHRLVTSETGECATVIAETDLPGEFISDEAIPRSKFSSFRQSAIIRTDNGCEGEYTIGVASVLDEFLEMHADDALSDYMLVRTFFPLSEDPSCGAVHWCSDSWYVRVTAADGAVISRH